MSDGPVGPHHDRHEWLKERKKGVGASEVPAILGVDPWKTERDIYFDKMRQEVDEPEPDRMMERGIYLEPIAADMYARETGRKLRRMPLVKHKQLPILMATLDRQILAGPDNPTAGLEIKVPAWQTFAKVKEGGIPAHWIIQAQTQQAITGYPFIAFGILHADSWRMLQLDFEPIPEMTEMILNRVGEWWEKHIVTATPPAPKIEPAPDMPEIPVGTELVVRNDEAWENAVDMFREAKEILDAAKAVDKAARDQIKYLMKEGDQAVAEGCGLRAYYRLAPGRRTPDKGLLSTRGVDGEKLVKALVHGHGWSLQEAKQIAADTQLDMQDFEKEGRPFEELRPYLLKGEG